MGEFITFLGNNLADFWTYTGFANATGGHLVMILVGLFFIYLAVAKEFEPMLLIPIGFGMLIGNIPFNMEAGLKVGTFISPHLIDFEERIMVDGRQISREDVTRIGNVLLEQEFGVTPTMFDYCVLMAVLYFKEQNCDLVIMETGLGGRLDSTNALGNPVVSVITRIGYDHMNILGNTIEEIAQEKAGIIKAGVPVVIAPQESEALAVLQRAAAAKGVRARCVQEKDLQGAKALQPGLLGAYQRDNAATAMWNSQSGMAGAYGNFKYRTVSDGGWCTQQ